MKIKSRQSKGKLIYALLSLLVIGGIYYAYTQYWIPSDRKIINDTNYSSPSNEQVNAGEQAKVNTVEKDQNTTNKSNANQGETPTSFSAQITAASVNSSILQIRTTIDGIYSDGVCKITLTNGGHTVTKTADIQPLPQSSTCKGFDIPTSELHSGTWQVVVSVTIDGQTAKATTSVKVEA